MVMCVMTISWRSQGKSSSRPRHGKSSKFETKNTIFIEITANNMKTMNNSPMDTPMCHGIIQPATLGRLVTAAPDRQLLLVAKLGFHYGLRAGEFAGLSASDNFVFENDRLAEITLDGRARGAMGRTARIIPINSGDRWVLRLLMPESGPLFSDRDPWGRFCRFARTIGIHLCRNCALRSFLNHARMDGMSAAEAASRTGRRELGFDRHFLRPFPREQAGEYFNLDFNAARIATLPRHRRSLAQVTT
jgi:hypothetical protein